MTTPMLEDDWTGTDVSIAEIERELARLRYASAAESAQPNLRTSVMTHIAWVPPLWLGAAGGDTRREWPSGIRRARCCSCRGPTSPTGSTPSSRSGASRWATGRCAAR